MEKEDPTNAKLGRVSENRGKFPHVLQAGSVEEFLQRNPGDPMYQQAGDGFLSLEQWEDKWQEFLRTLESPHRGWGIPRLPEKPSPWEDSEAFLACFERVAEACQWPQEEWVIRLLPAFSGEVEKAFNSLDVRDREDYGKVKAAILQGDSLRREKQRQQFRHFCYQEAEGPRGAYSRLRETCRGWLRVESKSKEQILELLILEQLLSILPPEIQGQVRESSPESCSQAVALAEAFLLRQEKQADTENISEAGHTPSEWGHPLLNIKQEEDGEASLLDAEEMVGELQGCSLKKPKNEKAEGNVKDRDGPQKQDSSQPAKMRDKPFLCQAGSFSEIPVPEERLGEKRDIKGLGANQRIHSREKENESATFEMTFPESTNIISQEQIYSGEQSYNCLEFGESSRQKIILTAHQKLHTGVDQENKEDEEVPRLSPGKAKQENQGKEGSGEVEKMADSISYQGEDFHEVIHMAEEAYKCLECGINLSNKTEYDFHSRTHSGKKTHQCIECGKSFLREKELVTHQRIHSGEKPYNCCGKGFSRKANFIRHQRQHPEERPYECSECGKKFRRSLHLQQHQRIHTGDEVFECSDCGKRFLQKSHLVHHQKSHSGEKSFKCSECGKSYRWSSKLQRHQRIHTGEKLFECAECGKKFNQTSNLQRHLKIHTGEKPFVCSECGKRFSRSAHLQQHQRMHVKKNCVTAQPATGALLIFHALNITSESTQG